MEEKINNQKIFCYVPPLVARLILDSDLKDSDVFFNNNENVNKNKNNNNDNNKEITKKNSNSNKKEKSKKKESTKMLNNLDSEFIKPNIFPISNILEYSLVMIIQLKGFEKLISTLIMKDQDNKKEKLFSEYLSVVIPRLLLKISGILAENGGEILKYNDFEFTVIWNFSDSPLNKVLKYQKFYAKYALISAIEIIKKFDDREVLGTKIEISIGMALGESSINFFGGERKRSEFLLLGEAIEQAEVCINNCIGHEIIISKEINDIFKSGQELITRDIGSEFDKKNLYAVAEIDENNLKNFEGFKGMKLTNNNINMNKNIYENLAKKVYILSSILPQGLVKYLDVGEEQNLKEMCLLTVETLQISMNIDLIDDLTQIQNIIFDIQKATYMTFGSLLYISKTYSGLIIRCVWGIDPGNFIDNTARAISTAILIGMLTTHYDMKIGIGITTGACFTGLINIQGNRKMFTLMGKKVNLSRTLADEALRTIITSDTKYLIYCDKLTMKYSQKWYRYAYVSRINVYFDQENDLYSESRDDFFTGIKTNLIQSQKNVRSNKEKVQPLIHKRTGSVRKRKKSKKKKNLKNKSIDIKDLNKDNKIYQKYEMDIKKNKLVQEIFSPIENEDYFIPHYNDPFPLIRTHKYNAFNPMNKVVTLNLINRIIQNKHTANSPSIKKEQMNEYSMKKLKKSQTIFGHSKEIERIINLMNSLIRLKKKQFIVVRGPAGVGKSLFVRKALNNFIGLNEKLSKNYFIGDEFLFCNIVKPFSATLPYNTISLILRKIYFNILNLKELKHLMKRTEDLSLDDEDFKHISYILSLGRNDIDIKNEIDSLNLSKKKFNLFIESQEEEKKIQETKPSKKFKVKISSVMIGLEGPYKYKNANKINLFFYEMIKIYKEHLNRNNKLNNSNITCPLIFIIDDVQKSNNFSFDFIQFLFNNEEPLLNPFIVILIQQTPLCPNYNPYGINKNMDLFISSLMDYGSVPNENKIISFDIKPINDKNILKKLIIYYFKDLVLNHYKTNLEIVDDQILDFLLIKSFNGIPLLVISLFKSLIKSDKFVQTLSGEFIITSELIDDNKIFDWSDLLLPYEYEKYASMKINSLLNFKEILILKYACVLGTIFDIQNLDKLNPLNSIIKLKDLEKVMQKLNNEYIIEIFSNYSKPEKADNIICKICFPLLREVYQQKFPMEFRSRLHMKSASILSTEKKTNFFSTEKNILILKRHLLYSEMNVINETEPKEIKTVKDILQNKKVLNYSNLKILLVKELCSKFCYEKSGYILEGNLELYIKSKWLRVSYIIDRRANIYFYQKDEKQGSLVNVINFSIQGIYRNYILKNFDVNKFKCLNVLEISVSSSSFLFPLIKNRKQQYYFRSEQREEVCKLDIAINFLRVKVNYDKYVNTYGISRFPLYKYKWFINKKPNKYYANIEQRQIYIKKRENHYDISNTDKLINESKKYYKPFTIIIKSTLSIFFGKIQENIKKINVYNSKKKDKKIEDIFNQTLYNYLYYFTTPNHISKKINTFLKESERKGIIKNNEHKNSFQSIPLDKTRKVSFNESIVDNTNNTFSSNKYNKTNSNKKFSKFINHSQENKNIDKPNVIENKSSYRSDSKKKINIGLIPKPKISTGHKTSKSNNMNNINTISFIDKNTESSKIKKKSDDLEIDEEITISDFNLDDINNESSIIFHNNNSNEDIGNISFENKKPFTVDKNGGYELNITEDSIFPKSIKDIICNENEITNDVSNNNNNNNINNNNINNNNNNNNNINNNNNVKHKTKSRNIKFAKKNQDEEIIFLKGKTTLPGDFVPTTIDSTIDKRHVQYIKTERNDEPKKEEVKIFDFDISSLMNNTELNKSKKELKYKTLYDDPKYVYIEKNKKNKKVHKSNLFVNLKTKKNKK